MLAIRLDVIFRSGLPMTVSKIGPLSRLRRRAPASNDLPLNVIGLAALPFGENFFQFLEPRADRQRPGDHGHAVQIQKAFRGQARQPADLYSRLGQVLRHRQVDRLRHEPVPRH
jgi:hypothetical protein